MDSDAPDDMPDADIGGISLNPDAEPFKPPHPLPTTRRENTSASYRMNQHHHQWPDEKGSYHQVRRGMKNVPYHSYAHLNGLGRRDNRNSMNANQPPFYVQNIDPMYVHPGGQERFSSGRNGPTCDVKTDELKYKQHTATSDAVEKTTATTGEPVPAAAAAGGLPKPQICMQAETDGLTEKIDTATAHTHRKMPKPIRSSRRGAVPPKLRPGPKPF